eukprot:5967342-Amphidinium_carterae.1
MQTLGATYRCIFQNYWTWAARFSGLVVTRHRCELSWTDFGVRIVSRPVFPQLSRAASSPVVAFFSA